MANITDIFTYSIIAGAATMLGTLLVMRWEHFARRNSLHMIGFAAGVMITISFLRLLPEASDIYQNAFIAALIGFLVFYLLQFFVMFHVCHDETCETHKLGILSFIALSFHSLLDGIAIVVGFEASPTLGILTTAAVILHEVPEGIVITSILLHAGYSKIKIYLYSFIVAAATPVGAIISFFFLKNTSGTTLGALLAFTAGSFLYLAAADLLPETHKSKSRFSIVSFFAGVIIILLAGLFVN